MPGNSSRSKHLRQEYKPSAGFGLAASRPAGRRMTTHCDQPGGQPKNDAREALRRSA